MLNKRRRKAEKRSEGKNWIVDWGTLSPPSFPPSFIYLMWNHASLLWLVSASITVSCLHRAVWGVRQASHSASAAILIWSDQTGLDGTGLAKQVCEFVYVHLCLFAIDDREQHVYSSAYDRLFLGLAHRVPYPEGTELELCPSLHLNALIHSVRLWGLCMESLTALLIGVRKMRPHVHCMNWRIWLWIGAVWMQVNVYWLE